MAKPNNSKTKWIWVSVLVLLVCVVATATAFFHRLDSFLLDDKGAISLITDNTSKTDDNIDKTENTQGSNVDNRPTSQVVQSTKNPDFEAGNDDNVWNTTTQVELLRVSYVNGEQVVTVKSENGDKVIAPGTENSYTFKLKNTGNVALDYTATLETKFSATNIEIPVTVRMNRYDGTLSLIHI